MAGNKHPLADKKFLVIDDQNFARDALRLIAQGMGAFHVDFAGSYADAIYKIKNQTPDVILCDYDLGKDRSGQQLLEEIRRFDLIKDETIFMMVTGEQSYEQVVAAVELVPDDYILKPFSPDKLSFRLEKIADKKTFFAKFFKAKRKDIKSSLMILVELEKNKNAKPYQFEIAKQKGKLLLDLNQPKAAEEVYRSIVVKEPFPWAKAGIAKALLHQEKNEEARTEIDEVDDFLPH